MDVWYAENQQGHGRQQGDRDVTSGSQIELTIELVAHVDALIGGPVLRP